MRRLCAGYHAERCGVGVQLKSLEQKDAVELEICCWKGGVGETVCERMRVGRCRVRA